jgi:hypothetical protein
MTTERLASTVYLEREGKAKTGYTWHHVTRWFSPEEAAVLTHMTLVLMDALWVAKVRYLGVDPPSRMPWVSGEALDGLRNIKRDGPVFKWRRQVATQAPARPEADQQSGASDVTDTERTELEIGAQVPRL